jgi:putative inorganic carbon (HCO3(-)) transporter
MTELRTATLTTPQGAEVPARGWILPQLGLAEIGVLLAIFLVYTNAIVVAVHFHGVPVIAGAIVPLLLAAPIAVAVFLRGERLWITTTLLWAFALVVVQFLGCLFAADPAVAMEELVVVVSEGALLYLLVSNAIRTEAALRRAIWTLLTAGALMGALLAYQQATHSYDNDFFGFAQLGSSLGDVQEGETPQRRLAGPIGEVNKFAQIMAILIPIALGSLAAARTRAGRVLALVALLFITLGMALAFSRGVAVGLVLTILITVAIGVIRMRFLVLAILVGGVALAAVPEYGTRLSSLADLMPGSGRSLRNADAATRGRLTEMEAAFLMFVDHPIIGAGPAMSRTHYREYAEIVGGKIWAEPRYSHSLYLGLAAEHGLLGLIAFGGLIAATWRDLQRIRKRFRYRSPDRAQLATGLLLALVVYLTTGIFLHASYARYFWLFLGLTGAASRILLTEDHRRGRVAITSPPEPLP